MRKLFHEFFQFEYENVATKNDNGNVSCALLDIGETHIVDPAIDDAIKEFGRI